VSTNANLRQTHGEWPGGRKVEGGMSLEERIVQQGVQDTATYERLLGSGAGLWSDDAEFATFLEHLDSIRHEKG
jgi:hypothetical protein